MLRCLALGLFSLAGLSAARSPADEALHALLAKSPLGKDLTMKALKAMAGPPSPSPPDPPPPSSPSAAPPLQRVLFSEATAASHGAWALDSTPAGYYYREGAARDSFVIFLEGGGLCVEPVDCHQRSKSHLGSMKYRGPTWQDGNNVLSPDPAFNPFWNWTHVFVPYVSGDVYVGVDRSKNLQGLHFSGHNILEAIVSNLLNTTSGLRTAKRVLLSGGSAGGIGTFQNADWLGETLRAANPNPGELQFAAAPQAGAFFVNSNVRGFFESSLPGPLGTWNFAELAASYLFYWFKQAGPPPFLDQSCMGAHPKTPHQCWSAAIHYPYIDTSLYVGQNKFDSNQAGSIMGHDWWPLPLGKSRHASAQAAYKRYFGKQTVAGIAALVLGHGQNKSGPGAVPGGKDGIFMPSCWKHTGNLCMKANASKVRGVTMAESLADWFGGGSGSGGGNNGVPHQLIDDCAGDDPCNPNCSCR